MAETKNCPFCGCEMKRRNGWLHHPENDCLLSSYNFYDEKKWNVRKPMERIMERLEEASFPHKFGSKVQMMILKNRAIEIVKEEGGVCETT